MKLTIDVPSLDKLCENVSVKYDIPNPEELKSIIQNELSTTITQYLSSRELVSTPVDSNVYIVSAPINDLYDIQSVMKHRDTNELELYVESRVVGDKVPVVITDTDGNEFINQISTNNSYLIKIGTVTKDKSNTWSVKIDNDLPVEYIDVNMYSRCWNCHKNNYIRDFINDIYNRINHLHQYSLSESITNDTDEDEDTVTYEIEYNPSEVIVYIHEYLEDDEDLTEETEQDQEEKIAQFFESIFGVDEDDIQIVKINESLSKVLLNVGASYMIGKGVTTILGKIGANLKHNPNADRYKSYQDQANANRGSIIGRK